MAERQLIEVEGLASADADLRELRTDVLLILSRRRKLQREVEILEEICSS